MTSLLRNCSLETLQQVRDALADEESFHVPSAVIEWLDEQIERREEALPPDPDGINDRRAEWAGYALAAFMSQTGSDRESAVTDLLCDLMHLADREGADFDSDLARARMHYSCETEDEPVGESDNP